MIKRESANNLDASVQPFAARDACMEAEYPCLSEYLLLRNFDDGSERETATLLVFAAEGLWKCCLNDRAEEKTLWASGTTYSDALTALESMLSGGGAEWRRTKPWKPAKKQS